MCILNKGTELSFLVTKIDEELLFWKGTHQKGIYSEGCTLIC